LLRQLAHGGLIGFSAARDNMPVTAIRYMPVSAPTRNARRQLQYRTDFVRVMRGFNDRQRALLVWVVLMNRTVRSCCAWEREQGIAAGPGRVMTELVAVLDRLVELLDSEVQEAIDRGAAA
jgi:hypothetical protein